MFRKAILALVMLAGSYRSPLGQLELNRSVSRAIARGETHRYTLRLSQDDFVRIALEQREIDVELSLRNEDADADEFGREEILFVAPETNSYDLKIAAKADDTWRGWYRLRVVEIRKKEAADANRLLAQRHAAEARKLETSAANATDASRHAEAALQTWRATGDRLQAAQVLHLLCRSQGREGRFQHADRSCEESKTLFRAVEDAAGFLNAHRSWANLGGWFQQERGTLAFHREQVEHWGHVGDRRGELNALRGVAGEQRRWNDLSGAMATSRRGIRLAVAIGDRVLESRLHDELAGILVKQKQYRDAITSAEQAVRLSLEVGDRRGLAAHRSTYCMLQMKVQDWRKAEACFQELREIRREQGDLSAEIATTLDMAISQHKSGNDAAALRSIREAVLLEDRIRTQTSDPIRREEVVSQTAALSFLGAVLRMAHARDPAKRYDIASFVEIDAARSPFITHERYTPPLSHIQALLRPGDLVVSYHLQDDEIGAAYLIEHNGFDLIPFALPRGFHSDLLRLHAGVSARPGTAIERGSIATTAQRISSMLLGPLRNRLGTKRLIVVPDESFAFLPFHILPDPDHPGRLLIENHEIIETPSVITAFTLRDRRARRTSPPNLLAIVTDPVFQAEDGRPAVPHDLAEATRSVGFEQGQSIPRLLFAAQEKGRIQSYVPQDELSIYAGYAANRSAVFTPAFHRHRILHFSTHGIANAEQPELSGLILSLIDERKRPIDGFLRLKDILDLPIASDLVTLGACQTAVGKRLRGHGVISLATAFLRSGASQVISTSWKVDDEASAELMASFYRELLVEGKPAPAALRAVQLRMLRSKRWNDPYFWGAFALHGDWAPITYKPRRDHGL